ncbi:hypothetical protein GQ54DRAFT_340233 [Martensiomyces pterosporus]|nr:hypothetical protein GQ54DRAFT_340233 [Martensiomyces pterosporus]
MVQGLRSLIAATLGSSSPLSLKHTLLGSLGEKHPSLLPFCFHCSTNRQHDRAIEKWKLPSYRSKQGSPNTKNNRHTHALCFSALISPSSAHDIQSMPGTPTLLRESRELSTLYNYDTGKTRPNSNLKLGLTITSAIALFCSLLCIVVFFILLAFNARRVNIPLVKLTMSIQCVNAIALIITLILTEVDINAELLCSSLRYVLYICYLSSIFMCCAVTIHLWLVITRRQLKQAKQKERWYFIVPFALAITLSASLATIPNSAYKIPNRCLTAIVPSREYLAIRWGLYYGWFVVAAAISILCMISVLISAKKLTRTTLVPGRRAVATTEAYRSAVNTRANSKRLRSLVFYTIAYPVISLVCNFPQLIQELLSTVMEKDLSGLVFASRMLLYSEGFFLALAFFLYPAVIHSIRDITHAAIQYWVIEQEDFWRMRDEEKQTMGEARIRQEEIGDLLTEKRDVKNFSSLRGRIYHFILARTPEGKLVSSL